MKLTMGKHELELGKQVGALADSTEALNNGNFDQLRKNMAENGYLLLRKLQKPETVATARGYLLEKLSENDQLDPMRPVSEGAIRAEARGGFLGGSKTHTRAPEFLGLVESPEIMGFFARFLEADVTTFDYKWLRVVGHGDNTGAHFDVVYMGRGTRNLYTCWTPITEVTYDMGPLAILEGSHQAQGFARLRETYGNMDVDRDNVTGAFSNDPNELIEKFGGQWKTTEFQPGDALIFGMFTMHASFNNRSDRFRISADTRYQRADEPMDERWVGENPIAHYAWMQGETVSMDEARKAWKV